MLVPAPKDPPAILEGLSDRLNDKLSELRAAGCTVLWIEAPLQALTTLLVEGGEQAILLHPDPARDVAWCLGCKIRYAAGPEVFVFARDEEEAISCHIV